MLKVSNLYKSFGNQKVLDDISFELESGEVMCLRGKSGAGKTTLIRCICNLDKADKGTISINGIESLVDGKPNKAYQNTVGMVSQGFDLFPNMTVMENLILAPVSRKLMTKEEAKKAAMALLESLDIGDKAESYPSRLSGGEKQRAWIAMTICQQPEILLLDEPITYLDVGYQVEVLELVRELCDRLKITIVMVLHDMNFTARYSDRIYVLKDKKVHTYGAPDGVIERENLRKVFHIDSQLYHDDKNGCPIVIPEKLTAV